MFTRAYGYNEGHFLTNWTACAPAVMLSLRSAPLRRSGLLRPPSGRAASLMLLARRRLHGVIDFARHVKQLRAKRAELRKPEPDRGALFLDYGGAHHVRPR